jgi:hypothetical protein
MAEQASALLEVSVLIQASPGAQSAAVVQVEGTHVPVTGSHSQIEPCPHSESSMHP